MNHLEVKSQDLYYICQIYMDKIIDEKLLHQWNKKYPPTEREKRKNIQIFKLQGNKNPFIN